MNVALRAVHDALRRSTDPALAWRRIVAAVAEQAERTGVVTDDDVEAGLRATGGTGRASEWAAWLRTLGVLDGGGRLDVMRAESVAIALELVGDSFANIGPRTSWAPVATLPRSLRALLRPPPMRHTAGVFLELVDAATTWLRLAAPFVDAGAVDFLSASLVGAGARGVNVRIITSAGHARLFDGVAGRWPVGAGRLTVTEVATDLSSLGSHAKVLVVDDGRGYVGSANLTAAGLGRHIEIGVEVEGPQTAALTRILDALDRRGTCVVKRPA